jgi:hypothetical protein
MVAAQYSGDKRLFGFYTYKNNGFPKSDLRNWQSPAIYSGIESKESFWGYNPHLDKTKIGDAVFLSMFYDGKELDALWNSLGEPVFKYVLSRSAYGMLVKVWAELGAKGGSFKPYIKTPKLRARLASYLAAYFKLEQLSKGQNDPDIQLEIRMLQQHIMALRDFFKNAKL